ncbi:MAG TPA: hypothetical protein PK280_16100 [Planctomycetota bacterium]|nr:hypothetical protein [Planctomycetota bacterium]
MGLEPIRVELTDFLKVELLRDEEERLAEELGAIEKQVRELLITAAERDYLRTLSPYYADRGPVGADAGRIGQLEGQRALVYQALETVRAQKAQFENALGVPAAGHGGRGGARRAGAAQTSGGKRSRFDSFEDFKQNQDQG